MTVDLRLAAGNLWGRRFRLPFSGRTDHRGRRRASSLRRSSSGIPRAFITLRVPLVSPRESARPRIGQFGNRMPACVDLTRRRASCDFNARDVLSSIQHALDTHCEPDEEAIAPPESQLRSIPKPTGPHGRARELNGVGRSDAPPCRPGISFESDHYTHLIPGQSENLFVLGPLHAQLENVLALISEPTKKRCRLTSLIERK
jgi:hypothetical protein